MTVQVDGIEGEHIAYWIIDRGHIIASGIAHRFADVLRELAHQEMRG